MASLKNAEDDINFKFSIQFQSYPRHCEPTGRANARPMTGSAKQSIEQQERKMDCFVAARSLQ
jgi:hypothetical protein